MEHERNFESILPTLGLPGDVCGVSISYRGKTENITRKDAPGSVAVYSHLVGHQDGEIGFKEAIYGIELFAEHALDERKNPGNHPNIARLVDIVAESKDAYIEVLRE